MDLKLLISDLYVTNMVKRYASDLTLVSLAVTCLLAFPSYVY